MNCMRFFFCIFLISFTSAFADSNTILKISAKGSGIPLGKAEIVISGQKIFSDPSGIGNVFIPTKGDGTVAVFHHGYERLEIKFDDLRPPGEFDVRLYPAQPDDDVILVTGSKNNAVSRTTISIEEASKVAPGGDPAQIVKLLPGVQSGGGGRQGGGGGGDIVVQGSGPNDSKYYVDDLEVPFIFHNIADLSVIPGDLMGSVDFESAGFGTEYGNATGGIITLHTKNEIPERRKTSITFNLPFYSGIFDNRPLSDNEALSVGLRRSYVDFFLNAYLTQRNKRLKDKSTAFTLSPYFEDAEVQYLKKTETGHTKLTLLGAQDGLKAVFPTNFGSTTDTGKTNISFSTGFVDLGLEKEERINHEWKYTTTPQIYYYRSKAVLGTSINGDQSVERFRVPTHFTYKISKNENLYLGIDPDITIAKTSVYAANFSNNDPTYDFEDAPIIKTVDTEHYANLASWASIEQAFGSITITPGLRAFYNGQLKKSSADPRIRARYALNDIHTFKGALGKYSESPQPLEGSKGRGNPNLHFVRSYHYVLGLESKWNENWNTDFNVYYKTGADLVQSDPTTNYNNSGAMRSHGFEAFIRRNMTGRFFGWLAYTYSKTQERPNPNSPWRTATYDQTHVGTLVADYKFTGTWDVGGRYDYHTGSTYTTVDSAVFNANLDTYDPRSNGINSGRLPGTNTLTLYFTHDFLYDTWKLAMRFGMEQFWFKPQVQDINYNYNYSKAQQVTSLTSIPFFELKGEF